MLLAIVRLGKYKPVGQASLIYFANRIQEPAISRRRNRLRIDQECVERNMMFWTRVSIIRGIIRSDFNRRSGKLDAAHSIRTAAIPAIRSSFVEPLKKREISVGIPRPAELAERQFNPCSRCGLPPAPQSSKRLAGPPLEVNDLGQVRQAEFAARENGLAEGIDISIANCHVEPVFEFHEQFNHFDTVAMEIVDQAARRADFIPRNLQLFSRNVAHLLFNFRKRRRLYGSHVSLELELRIVVPTDSSFKTPV